MAKVTKLQPSTKVKGRWLCYLEDGTILRMGENEVAAFALYVGMELTEEIQEDLDLAVQRRALRDRGLDLIALRPLSRKELLDKLTAKPRDPEKQAGDPVLAEETAAWLEELGYLNDEEYAKTVVRHYSAKGYGMRRIQDELWRHGVPRALWAQAQEEAAGPEAGIDAFLRQKLKGNTPDQRALKRVSDALARRGYRWDEIRDGLRRYGTEVEEE